MTSPEPPFSIEPVVGWRVWRLVRIRGRLALRSLAHDAVWMPDQAMHATCGRLSSSGHRSPGDGCTCGLYATSTPEALARASVFNPGTGVVGAIAMWGRVVEHGRGARSEFAYPARLRLVCGSCLAQGSGAVPPVHVIESASGLVPVCGRHIERNRQTVPASTIEAELLSTFGVELLPLQRVDRSLRIPHRSAASAAARLLEQPGRALIMLVNGFFAAMMILLVAGTVLSLAFSIVGGVAKAMFGHDGPSPTAIIAVPPSAQPIEDVAHTVTAVARPIVNDRPELSDDRQLITVPAFPALALLCGVRRREPGEHRAVRAPPARRCSGSRSARLRTVPRRTA